MGMLQPHYFSDVPYSRHRSLRPYKATLVTLVLVDHITYNTTSSPSSTTSCAVLSPQPPHLLIDNRDCAFITTSTSSNIRTHFNMSSSEHQAFPAIMITSPSSTAIKWTSIPDDVRLRILSLLPLQDVYNANLAFPHPAHSAAFRQRIQTLRPLRDAWVHAEQSGLPSHSNPPHLTTSAARLAQSPLQFTSLKTLTLRHAGMRALPGIHECTQLRVLDASQNRLISLPPTLRHCSDLRVLNLGYNNLQHFPLLLIQLPRLCTLLLHNNPIKTLPSNNWVNLAYLYRLGLFDCELTGPLPDQLCKLLATRTKHGRHRSVNLQRNNFDTMSIAHLFTNFPHLSKSILM